MKEGRKNSMAMHHNLGAKELLAFTRCVTMEMEGCDVVSDKRSKPGVNQDEHAAAVSTASLRSSPEQPTDQQLHL